MSTNWIERWDRFTCNYDYPDGLAQGQTVEVTERKMDGYLVSAVTGPCWVRKFAHRDGMPGPRWTPAPAPTDVDEAVRLSVLNTIAENDGDDVDAGTPLSAILDTIEMRSGKHPSIAYVTTLLASIGATERDGLWSVASLPVGWVWRPTGLNKTVALVVGDRCPFALAFANGMWSAQGRMSGPEPTQDAAIERATWECRRRGLFAPVAGGER